MDPTLPPNNFFSIDDFTSNYDSGNQQDSTGYFWNDLFPQGNVVLPTSGPELDTGPETIQIEDTSVATVTEPVETLANLTQLFCEKKRRKGPKPRHARKAKLEVKLRVSYNSVYLSATRIPI
jgi:hypothetical protein